MVEIEANKSIKNYKQEIILNFGLAEVIIGVIAVGCGISTYFLFPSLPEMVRGDICMIVVMAILVLSVYRVNNLLLYKIAIKRIGTIMNFGKPIVYSHGKEKMYYGNTRNIR